MPRFDGSYPEFGLEYNPDYDLSEQVLPQVESTFSGSYNLTGGATPAMTTGSRSLDPAVYTDLSDWLDDGTPAVIIDGIFGSNTSQPMGFTCPSVVMRVSGSGATVSVTPSNIGSNWFGDIQFIDEDGNGYLSRISPSLIAIYLVNEGEETLLKSSLISTSSSNQFSFVWDGNSRFKASWGSDYIAEVDDTYSVLGNAINIVSRGLPMTAFVAGVTRGMEGFDTVDAPYRNVSFANILYYDGVKFPWPQADSSVFSTAYNAAVGINSIPFVTLAYCPPSYADVGGAPAIDSYDSIINDWISILDDYSLDNFIVWKDNHGLRCGIDDSSSSNWATPGCVGDEWDYIRYAELYEATYNAFVAVRGTVQVYGPNVQLAQRGEGYDTDYGGVLVDSRDIDFLTKFIEDVSSATPRFQTAGIAVSGDFSNEDWELLIPELKALCGEIPLLISASPQPATPTIEILSEFLTVTNDQLDSGDVVFTDFSGFTFNSPRLVLTEYDWTFTATLSLPETMTNARLKVVAISDRILLNGTVSVEGDGATPYILVDELPVGNEYVDLGDLEPGTYSLSFYGDRGVNGTAMLRVGIYSDNFDTLTIADTKYLGG